MVQLKVNLASNKNPRHFCVSIPYGTIKSPYSSVLSQQPVRFQFLMVQLKGFRKSISFKFTLVSIPYGTIKRPAKQDSDSANDVSIPYGTIKSMQQVIPSLACLSVSIPYGTIKRR